MSNGRAPCENRFRSIGRQLHMPFTVFLGWGHVPRGTGIAVRARLIFNRNEWDSRRRTMRFTCCARQRSAAHRWGCGFLIRLRGESGHDRNELSGGRMRSPLRIVHGWSSLVPRPALSLLEKANLKCPDGKGVLIMKLRLSLQCAAIAVGCLAATPIPAYAQ